MPAPWCCLMSSLRSSEVLSYQNAKLREMQGILTVNTALVISSS